MKKIISILSLIALILSIFSLISCKKKEEVDSNTDFISPEDNFNIAETREIILGNAVDSVVFTTREGEKVTFDNTADFYEIYDKVGAFVEFNNEKKHSYVSEVQLEGKSKFYTQINQYYFDDVDFREFRVKKEGDDSVATIEEYSYPKQLDNKITINGFSKYIYKDDKAFGGIEYNEHGGVVYSSTIYPLMPAVGSELSEMHAAAYRPRNIFFQCGLFSTYDQLFETFVTREYELYENYIVFKQTAPFLTMQLISGQDPQIIYMSIKNSTCSITQEAYINVKTGEIELIKVYGNTRWHIVEYWGKNVDIDMQIYVHDINKSECEQKINNLIDYVKSNSDQ